MVAFLKNVPPFQFLSMAELLRLSGCMTLEFFPKDTVILSAGHPASESLYVVHKGGVKLALAKFYSLDVDNSHHALRRISRRARVAEDDLYVAGEGH